MGELIIKRSATERLIIAKTLLESVLQDMPSGELIQCKDCKFHRYQDGIPYCIQNRSWGWDNDDYCSRAERRNDG